MPRKSPPADLTALLRRLSQRGPDAPSMSECLHIIEAIRAMGPEAAVHLDRFLVERQARLTQAIDQLEEIHGELREKLTQLTAPPWPTATFLEMLPDEAAGEEGGLPAAPGDRSDDVPEHEPEDAPAEAPRAMIFDGRSRVIINVDPDADLNGLVTGDEVLLSPDRTVLLGPTPVSWCPGGELAQFDRVTGDGRLVIRAREQEFLAVASGRLDVAGLEPGDPVRWDRALSMVIEKVARPAKSELYLEETPPVTFADIGGLDPLIEKIQNAILLRRQHSEKSALYDLQNCPGLLLCGPPGNGKTLLARAIANWLATLSRTGRSRFMGIKPGQFLTPWYGESEANIRKVFAIAHRAATNEPDVPVLMFFDEIDSIGRSRGARLTRVGDQVLPAFMEELDGVTPRQNVLVVAATNRADALDPALMRPGRLLDNLFDLPRPGRTAAREIFSSHLKAGVPLAAADVEPDVARANLLDLAVARLYSPNGEGPVARLVLRDGSRRDVMPRDLINGASIANIMRCARETACRRDVEGGEPGVRPGDVLAAIEAELDKLARPLTPTNAHLYVDDLAMDNPVVSIERPERSAADHTFLRIA